MHSLCALILVTTLGVLAVAERNVDTQQSAPPDGNRVNEIGHISASYREKAIELVLSEANEVARELHLHEQLPITKSNVLHSYISPPRLAKGMGTFGNITTSNYTYYISVSNKFSFLTKRNLESDYGTLRKDYLLPKSDLNTNSALKIAFESLY